MRDLIILGTGGSCLDFLDLAAAVNAAGGGPWRVAGFLDDDPAKAGAEFGGVKVLGPLPSARNHPDAAFLNGIGNPENFRRKPGILATTGLAPDRFASLVHPLASISRHARLGRGVAIFPGAFVGARAELGDHVLLLPGAVVSHDATVGGHAILASLASVAGGARIGHACYLGTQCAVAGGIAVGEGALVGMGAVVLRDVEAGAVVVGNPARVLRGTPEPGLS